MVSLQFFPDGLIVDILTCGLLNHVDVLRFGETCKRFFALSNSSSVWKALCWKEWPVLQCKASKVYMLIEHSCLDSAGFESKWKTLYVKMKLIFDQLENIFHTYFSEDQLDDRIFESFLGLSEQYSYEFVFAVLNDIITSNLCPDLTCKYYASKAFDFLQHACLKPQIMSLLNDAQAKDSELSPLMQGVILIEQWFNPLKQYPPCNISDFIKEAAHATLVYFEKLLANQPSKDPAKIEHLRFLSLNHVFFEDFKFCGNQGDYFNVNNSFIHQVIASRHGIPILLSIIYREIAMRIGLDLECVNNPGHFVLRWKVEKLESEKPTISEIAKAYRYIDVFNRGAIMHYSELPNTPLKIQCASLNEVLHRVSLNVDAHSRISRQLGNDVQQSLNAYTLCLMFEPNSHKVRSKRMQLNLNYNINLESILEDNEAIPSNIRTHLSLRPADFTDRFIRDRIEKKEKSRQAYKPTISLRSDPKNENVNYSVGMVMRHRRYDYICVIRGWDSCCGMSDAWVMQMGVHEMERGREQPFYHVLVDKDGSERYAAEDSLELVRYEDELDHAEIGHYFYSTRSQPIRHYIPNSELEMRYPEDLAFTMKEINDFVEQLELDEPDPAPNAEAPVNELLREGNNDDY